MKRDAHASLFLFHFLTYSVYKTQNRSDVLIKKEIGMKILHTTLFALVILFSCITLPQAIQLTPQNTIIISDIDDVLILKSLFLSCAAELKNFIADYKKDADGIKEELTDKKGNSISGLTFHLLYHGMRKPYLTTYVPWLIKHLETSRRSVDGTVKIYSHLKAKGYEVVFATNKDRIAYDLSAQAMGTEFTNLAEKVFVAHPGNNPEFIAQLQTFADLPTTPINYREFLHKTLTIQPTDTILHAPGKKPDAQYYEYIEQHLDQKKNMIFIDDKPSNVHGFENALQENTSAQRIGIIFKNPAQLAQKFVDLGMLSETDDQKLLEDIRYPGIWGKMKLFGKKLTTGLKPATAA